MEFLEVLFVHAAPEQVTVSKNDEILLVLQKGELWRRASIYSRTDDGQWKPGAKLPHHCQRLIVQWINLALIGQRQSFQC